jgi:hypothetical protein
MVSHKRQGVASVRFKRIDTRLEKDSTRICQHGRPIVPIRAPGRHRRLQVYGHRSTNVRLPRPFVYTSFSQQRYSFDARSSSYLFSIAGTIFNGNSYPNSGWSTSPETPMRINLNMNLRMSPWIASSSHAQASSQFDYHPHHGGGQTTLVRSSGPSMGGLTSTLFDPPVLTPCPTAALCHAPQQHVRINSPRLVGEQYQFMNAPSMIRHQSFGQILPTTLASDFDVGQVKKVQVKMLLQ